MLFGDVPDIDIVSVHYILCMLQADQIYVLSTQIQRLNNPSLPIQSNLLSALFFSIAVCTFWHVPSEFQYYLTFTKGLTILY